MHKTSLKIYFRMMGENYDVNEITERLGIKPSQTWKEGDLIRNTGRRRTYTAWIYSTDTVETLDLNMLIKEITGVFLPVKDEIIELKKLYDLDISIDFVISIRRKQPPAVYFKEDFIEFVAKIEARMDLDTYVY